MVGTDGVFQRSVSGMAWVAAALSVWAAIWAWALPPEADLWAFLVLATIAAVGASVAMRRGNPAATPARALGLAVSLGGVVLLAVSWAARQAASGPFGVDARSVPPLLALGASACFLVGFALLWPRGAEPRRAPRQA